jgi:hypothetical protein
MAEDRVTGDEATEQGDHLERRALPVVVGQELLFRQEL